MSDHPTPQRPTHRRRRRRSYHQVSYRLLVKLPVGPIPAACLPQPPSPSRLRRIRRRWQRSLATFGLVAAMLPAVTFADVIYTTYLAGKQENPTTVQLQSGTTTAVTGTETFDARPLVAVGSGTPFTSDFGTAGAVTGSFSGNYGITNFDQYGGAGGTGRYITTRTAAGLSIKFTTTAAVPGVNYFGVAISALDGNNVVNLYRTGSLLTSFDADILRTALRSCPNLQNPYCGNPTTGANGTEQYVYLNFFDLSDYFDEVRLTQASGGGFEADNFTAGFREANVPFGAYVSVMEPASALLLLPGLLGLAMLRRSGRSGPALARVAHA